MNGHFTPDLDTVESVVCDTCNTKCTVIRNYNGYRGFAAAMGKTRSRFDLFTCPHRSEEWHKDAFQLISEYNQTKSQRLKNLIKKDINDVILKHTDKDWAEVIETFTYRKKK